MPLLPRPLNVTGNAIVVEDKEETEPTHPTKQPAATDAVTDDMPVASESDKECAPMKGQRTHNRAAVDQACCLNRCVLYHR